jgi:hypothetical protein
MHAKSGDHQLAHLTDFQVSLVGWKIHGIADGQNPVLSDLG